MSEESQILVASGSGIQTIVPQLAVASPQVVYLDFDGAETSYYSRDLDIFIDNITVDDSGFDSETISLIVATLNEQFGDDIVFTADIPYTDGYSTIYVGVTSAFEDYGDFLGLAETIDSGNQIHDDNAFVMLNSMASLDLVTSVIAHETEHIVNGKEHGRKGLGKYAEITSIVSSGQSISNVVVLPENGIRVLGVANDITVSSGGSFVIISGGAANKAIVSNGGWMVTLNGGIANSTTVSTGGKFAARSGGTANFTVVNESGIFSAASGGMGNSTIINGGGSFFVF